MTIHIQQENILRASLEVLITMANFPSVTADKAILLWNGKWTFSYHQWPEGSVHVDYRNTLNHYPSKDAAELAMGEFAAAINRGF